MIPVSHNDQNSYLAGPEWCLLGEYLVNGIATNGEIRNIPQVGMLLETIRNMGMEGESIGSIERKLIELIGGAVARLNQLRFETPITIRLFCQKKMVEDENSLKSFSQIIENQTPRFSKDIHQPVSAVNGGWGYFLVERCEGFSPNSTVSTFNLVELYLYKEGE